MLQMAPFLYRLLFQHLHQLHIFDHLSLAALLCYDNLVVAICFFPAGDTTAPELQLSVDKPMKSLQVHLCLPF